MRIEEQTLSFDFTYPAPSQPAWAPKVERWYQLDSPSYGFCEFYFSKLRESGKPSILFLASSEGSLPTDRAFAETGALSPAKFVHTLPNVRASSLCQTMEWFGPVLCIQNGEASFERAVDEARGFLRRVIDGSKTGPSSEVPGIAWVLAHESKNGQNRVVCCVLTALHNDQASISLASS